MVDEKNKTFDSRNNCNAIIETASNTLLYGCKNTLIPNGVVAIDEVAFWGASFSEFVIPNSVRHIRGSAFNNCTNLTSIVLSENLETIEEYAFSSSPITSIFIPAKVSYIHPTAFNRNGLTSVKVDENNTTYDSRDGCNAIIDKSNDMLLFGCAISTIPRSVRGFGQYAFTGCDMPSIVIPNNIQIIESEAFYYCKNLTSIILPNNVRYLGGYAFGDCFGLESIVLSDSIDVIRSCTFLGCSKLTSVKLPEHLKSLESGAFLECRALTTVAIPNSVTSIGSSCFGRCDNLSSIIIPDSVKRIESWTFMECPNLSDITFGKNLESIADPFGDCLNLYSITSFAELPPKGRNLFKTSGIAHVRKGCKDAYANDANFKNFIIVEDADSVDYYPTVCSGDIAYVDGIKYKLSPETHTAEVVSGSIVRKDVVIPDSIIVEDVVYAVTALGEGAFYRRTVENIVIGDAVESIGHNAFNYSPSLTSVHMGKGVKSIGNNVFQLCKKLESVILPDSMESLGRQVFSYCEKLKSIQIPKGLTTINQETFYNCRRLKSVVIPDDVKTIGKGVFFGCDSLQKVVLPSGLTTIEEQLFYTCRFLTDVNIPEGVTAIKDGAFYHCNRLDVKIPDGVTTIGMSAFAGCALSSVTLPERVTSIGVTAFGSCKKLTSFFIPKNVKSIGRGAISGCSLMESIVVDKDNIHFDSRNNCNAIINKSTNDLIQGCKNTIIPDDVVSIASSAFSGTVDLDSIVIPASVTSIGANAFYNCPLVSVVCLAVDPPTLEKDSFFTYGTLHVVPGAKEAYETAKYWYNFTVVDDVETAIGWNSAEEPNEISGSVAYDFFGRPIDASYKGIAIKDGKKVLIR